VRHVQARELDLPRTLRHVQTLDQPLVQGPVVLELEAAEAVRHLLEGIALAVGHVVRRIDAPRIARAVVRCLQDAIEDRVPHEQVGVAHVDLGAQDAVPLLELPGTHAAEQAQILLGGAGPIRGVRARDTGTSALCADLIDREVVDVRVAGLDESLPVRVELLEEVGGVVLAILPVEAQPPDVVLDGVDEARLLLARVRVVEPQVAEPAVLGR